MYELVSTTLTFEIDSCDIQNSGLMVSSAPKMSVHYLLLAWIVSDKKSAIILFFFFLRRSFTLVTQAGVQWRDLGSLKLCLLGSSNSPASASQSAGITGVSHHTRPVPFLLRINSLAVQVSGACCFAERSRVGSAVGKVPYFL